MSQDLLEKHEDLVVGIATAYLDNMQRELGKKYKDPHYQIDPSLSEEQHNELQAGHAISDNEFSELYTGFLRMGPSQHLEDVMRAFSASGGNVDVSPVYDEESQRLNVSLNFVIENRKLKNIDGLAPLEDLFLRMNAMVQVEGVLADAADTGAVPSF